MKLFNAAKFAAEEELNKKMHLMSALWNELECSGNMPKNITIDAFQDICHKKIVENSKDSERRKEIFSKIQDVYHSSLDSFFEQLRMELQGYLGAVSKKATTQQMRGAIRMMKLDNVLDEPTIAKTKQSLIDEFKRISKKYS